MPVYGCRRWMKRQVTAIMIFDVDIAPGLKMLHHRRQSQQLSQQQRTAPSEYVYQCTNRITNM